MKIGKIRKRKRYSASFTYVKFASIITICYLSSLFSLSLSDPNEIIFRSVFQQNHSFRAYTCIWKLLFNL